MENIESNLAFVILCPELNIGGLKSTVTSIRYSYSQATYMCMLSENANEADMKEFSGICPVMNGGATYTSLINNGIKNSNRDWNFIVVAGNIIRPSLLRKYQYFLKSNTEILYSVVDRNTWLFEDATINGILINKKAITEIGDFPDSDSLIFSKLMWSSVAAERGYKFKGLVGVKI